MKLLELCLSTGFGGLELYAEKVIRHYYGLDKPCLAVIRSGTLLDQRLAEDHIPREYLRVRSQYFPIITAWKLARLFKENHITTLHIHWRRDLPLAVLAKIFVRQDIRLVYTRQMALTRTKSSLYHRFLYAHVDMYLTITRKLEEDAKRFLPLPAEKISTLYYGVPEAVATDSKICLDYFDKIGLKQEKFTVGLFGRIEFGKGQHLLVEALDVLQQRGVSIQAAIIGHVMDQKYVDELQETLNNKKLKDSVRFPGFHPSPPSIMGCFDVIILATYAETFGLVLAEAMRAGTAVMGTNAGGVPEIIKEGETGLLFEPGNSKHLADGLEKLATNPELVRQLARNGKQYADQTFSEGKHFIALDHYLTGKSN